MVTALVTDSLEVKAMIRIIISVVLLIMFSLFSVQFERPVYGQSPARRSPDEAKALFTEHQSDFDYLLGDWAFTSVSKEWGKNQGFWSAVRLAEGAQILDEYRVTGDQGETYYASSTIRSYNAVLDQWELISADTGTGLQNFGTARKVGPEMQIEQKFGVMSNKPSLWKIKYYNIKPDSFSWTADVSFDGGKTWVKEHLTIEARRIGPARSLGQLAPFRKNGKIGQQ
jgi:hypothetical protein